MNTPRQHLSQITVGSESIPLRTIRARVNSLPDASPQYDLLSVPVNQNRRNSSISIVDIQRVSYSSNGLDYHEILYQVTDVVLILCGILFAASSIVHLSLWLYGLYRYF